MGRVTKTPLPLYMNQQALWDNETWQIMEKTESFPETKIKLWKSPALKHSTWHEMAEICGEDIGLKDARENEAQSFLKDYIEEKPWGIHWGGSQLSNSSSDEDGLLGDLLHVSNRL